MPLWVGQYRSHGLTVSEDGNRAYVAALDGLIIVDTSEIQARKPNPQVREISRLTWPEMTIPQVAIPVTIGGKPYLVEVDEFSGDARQHRADRERQQGRRRADHRHLRRAGAARRLEHPPRGAPAREPRRGSPTTRARAASCRATPATTARCPQREEPGIVACSFIASGLRVFDIRDPERPKEIAYFTTPAGQARTAGPPSNFAMSAPAFDARARRGLVRGRQHRLLRAADGGGRVAVPAGRELRRPPRARDDAATRRPARTGRCGWPAVARR